MDGWQIAKFDNPKHLNVTGSVPTVSAVQRGVPPPEEVVEHI